MSGIMPAANPPTNLICAGGIMRHEGGATFPSAARPSWAGPKPWCALLNQRSGDDQPLCNGLAHLSEAMLGHNGRCVEREEKLERFIDDNSGRNRIFGFCS